MAITTYTSYNEVRLALGVSEKELTDTDLAAEMYENALSLALAEVDLPDEAPGPGPLSTRFVTIAAIDAATRTSAEQKLYDLTRMYATYAVALEIASTLAMAAPKSISDSKTTLTRFSPESVYLGIQESLEARLASMLYRIENINETSVTSFAYMGVASPDTDRITDA